MCAAERTQLCVQQAAKAAADSARYNIVG
eukprot:COSAG02_NODE_2342_length_9101_cov_78.830038_11_plen_28_part_01